MLKTYEFPEFDYRKSADQEQGVGKHAIVIIGAGPVGLTAALDLAKRGEKVIVVDDNNTVSVGSRAVCYAKRALEVFDRLGCADRMIDKGIVWNIGKVFREEKQVYQFDLLPEEDHKIPAFINLQQYYLEEYLVDECQKYGDLIDIRWKTKIVSVQEMTDYVRLYAETPDGVYEIQADYVIACDGANSDMRRMLRLPFKGQFFQDRFLIADVVMKADFPTERWFWFDPPFHPNQSVLLHRQSDDVWRIDFQLGWETDPEEAKKPENIMPLLKQMLGEQTEFELEWASVYQFACRRMDSFRQGRIFFAGDAAHQVSPFGARGANTGIQDIDNLAWKLAYVRQGLAPASLLDSYDEERVFAADENLLNSTRSTDFITPKSAISKAFRDATLELAVDHEFARPLVNSGRLSRPTPYQFSSLNVADQDKFACVLAPGHNCSDAPIEKDGQADWLLSELGDGFTLLIFGEAGKSYQFDSDNIPCNLVVVGQDIKDVKSRLAERYDGQPGTTYLIRPDQYIAARWRQFNPDQIRQAMAKSLTKA